MACREPGAHVVTFDCPEGEVTFIGGVPTASRVEYPYHAICTEDDTRVIVFSKKTKVVEIDWEGLIGLGQGR